MKNNILSILPKMAKKIGEKSVQSTSYVYINQPKVPESMKKQK